VTVGAALVSPLTARAATRAIRELNEASKTLLKQIPAAIMRRIYNIEN
jgi:hypothetical protein